MLGRGSVVGLTLLLANCGSGSPSAPTTPPNPSPGGMTVTITASAISPKELRVSPGTRVLFLNSDTRQRYFHSDPHPEATDCPEVNTIGIINPGQTKETGNLNTMRTCGYHDHNSPGDARFHGRIVIQ